jgi:outer membrane scaffolding protein for murein synthesis (MipA/OmpV family)
MSFCAIKRAMRLLLPLLFIPLIATAQDDDPFLGAGVYARPKFDGSASRTVQLIPAVRYYGQRWFARTTQGILEGGARWSLGKGVDAGAQLAYESGPLDHHPGASLGAHLEVDRMLGPAPLNGLVRLRQFLDNGRGLELDARGTVGVYEGHGFAAGLFGQATWASGKAFDAYYAVHESGLLFTSLGALGSYDLSRRWLLLGSLEERRLGERAARSRFVERRSSAYASASLAYVFR